MRRSTKRTLDGSALAPDTVKYEQAMIEAIANRGKIMITEDVIERYASENFLLRNNLDRLNRYFAINKYHNAQGLIDQICKQIEIPERIRRAGVKLPEDWEFMGSSEKDFWQDQQIRRIDLNDKNGEVKP